MSSTTAHFGLTKAASNERYSLPVVNGNSDIIDTQMYNNQQSAAKLMVGATSSADGESGRVPAPTSADRGKYLKGDGTWDTPSGGGGSSTLAGLSDVDISSPVDGQALVYDAINQEWVNGDVGGGGDITDLDFSDLTASQTSDIMTKLNSGVGNTDSGTFTTGTQQYEKVEVNCGFRPTYISVILPFQSGDTTAVYDASISTTRSTWTIPQEHNTYTIQLGSETGETGITDITNTGFKFRCNAPNTRNVQCTFSASISGQKYIQTVDFDDISASQGADILGKLDFTNLTATQIADLKTALGIN